MIRFLFLFLVFSQILSAQITKQLSSFSKVISSDKISVFLIASTENKIEISGTDANQVELINENNELKIKMPAHLEAKGNDILVKVFYTQLNAIEAAGGSNIGFDKPISSSNFDILVKENSFVKIGLTSKKVVARVSQGSNLEINGTIDLLDVVASNASKIKADKCKTIQATVSVNAGATASVNATDLVDAKVRAGGTITIFGNPKKVNQATVLGGEIIVSNY